MAKKDSISERSVTISQAVPLMEICIKAERPVFLWAGPGIGKSDIVRQIAESIVPTAKEAAAGLLPGVAVDVRLGQMMPTDIMGIPYYNKDTKTMEWARPGVLPSGKLCSEHKMVILFLDELNTAPATVQAAAYQLVLDRKTGSGFKLPDNVAIIAAGNRENDRGVTTRMPTPLANRFIHLKLRSNFDSWFDWAIKNDIHPDIVGYLSFAPQYLDQFDPANPDHAFATPRSWKFVDDIMQVPGVNDEQLAELVAGTVGEAVGIQFMAHRKIASSLPNPADVLSGDVVTSKIQEISAQYSLTISCCHLLKERQESGDLSSVELHKQADTLFKFMMSNFEVEMNVMGATVLLRKYKLPLQPTKLSTWNTWHAKYLKYLTKANL